MNTRVLHSIPRFCKVVTLRGSSIGYNIRRFCSVPESLTDEGFTRSIYCKPQTKEIVKDGKTIKILTGLVDPSSAAPGDEWLELITKLTYKHNLDTESFVYWLKKREENRNRLRQIVSDESIEHLGLDLAIAHMVCAIGGRVKFIDNPKWFYRYARTDAGLPRTYIGGHKLESVDLSGTRVVYEGFELLHQLTELRHLRLRRCLQVDDFCLSRVGRISSLELLDVGECPRLTSKGLATLTQLKNLRHLLVHNNPMMEDKELVCLLLEEHLPKLVIDGVNYLDALPADSREKIYALIANDNAKYVDRIEQGDSEPGNAQSSEQEDVPPQEHPQQHPLGRLAL